MGHLGVILIRHQILFGDISDIMSALIFGEQMVIGLILGRANLFGDGFVPVFGIGENRVDIEHNAAKIKQAVADNLADLVFSGAGWDRVWHVRLSHFWLDRFRRRFFLRLKQARNTLYEVGSMTHNQSMCYSFVQQTRFGPHMADEKVRGDVKAGSRNRSRAKGKAPLYAAVDLGTNNCRLLIAARKRDSFSVIDSHSQIARLGEGLATTGRMSDASIERAMDALHKIARKLKAKRVGHIRCIATEACRRAENGAAFIQRVREETGLTFKIIGPQEEARLALIGCHNLIEPDVSNVLVIDIGGGSTELSWVDAGPVQEGGLKGLLANSPIQAWTSLPIGVVTLTEAFAHLPEEQRYPAMLERAHELVNKWKSANDIRDLFEAGEAHVIGTSGTVTCLTGVHLGLTKYRRDLVDGQWITGIEMLSTVQRLKDAGPEGVPKFPTIGHDRAGLMMAGCAIVEATWTLAPGGRMRVADRGLREGLLLSMMQGPKRNKRGGKRRRQRGSRSTVQKEVANG